MTTGALVTMLLTMGIVTAFAAVFFRKILKTPPKSEIEE